MNALARFLDVPAEDIVTGAGSLGALNQLLTTFAGQNDDGKADEVIYAWRSFEAYPICVGLAGAESVRIPLTGRRARMTWTPWPPRSLRGPG